MTRHSPLADVLSRRAASLTPIPRCAPDIVLFIGLEGIAVCDHAASSQAAAGGSVLNASKASNTAQVSAAPTWALAAFPPRNAASRTAATRPLPIKVARKRPAEKSRGAGIPQSSGAGILSACVFGWQAHKVRTFYPFAQVRSWENHGEFVIIEVTKKGKGPKQKPIQIKIKADEGCVPLPPPSCIVLCWLPCLPPPSL